MVWLLAWLIVWLVVFWLADRPPWAACRICEWTGLVVLVGYMVVLGRVELVGLLMG